ncbi:DUF2971 domain-containing protein [Pseudomonas putida]|uniref:DUF2971 domain-containing protein n=1 Tax=Pseudomonas putida TaxID=303 RepID=UPI0018AB1F56|nr:DUF2971 domain-containing protein [Pseudomonas putida]MBF8726748.1 DUF2971 domain-containing protein [Pseudomonas putida]MBF8764280.1 DUF2971 domain-containing protein [Pseudomonas putida]
MDRDWVRDFIENFSSATIGDMDIPKLVDGKTLHTPDRLFKIRPCGEYAFRNLSEKTLWLSVASEFNDPYDTAFWIDYRKLAAWEKLDELGFSQDQVATALSSDDPIAAVVELASGQESCPLNVDQWLHEVEVLAPNHQAGQLPNLIDQLKSSYKICSLSERVDSVLMWSHYGADHTGFAMEYDFTRLHRNKLPTLTLWPVAYTDKLFEVTHILRAHRLGKDFNELFGIAASLCKAVDWQYEREWRWVIPDDDREVNGFSRSAPLKAVHLGAKISDTNALEILNICSEINIPVYKVTLAPNEFRMISVLTSLDDWCSANGRQQGNMPREWMKQGQSLRSDLTEEGTETA